MREAEIELVTQSNQNATAIDEINTTTAQLGNQLSQTNDNLASLTARLPVTADDIADNAVTTEKIADSAVTSAKIRNGSVMKQNIGVAQISASKLEQDLQDQLTFLSTVPKLTYGESDAVTVSANGSALVDITFPSALTEAPNVYCMARSTVCIECNVEQVTNQQASIRLYNNTNSDASGVSIDWLAISGR